MNRKVIFWLAPNEKLIPADQVPGAIADTLYPPPERKELAGQAPNDPNAIKRLEAEREQAQQLRIKFPYLKDGDKFSIGDLNDYLSRLGMVAEIRHRSDVIDNLDPECRWTNRLFVDGFKSANSGPSWTLIPAEAGQQFQGKLDADSSASWTAQRHNVARGITVAPSAILQRTTWPTAGYPCARYLKYYGYPLKVVAATGR